MLTFSTINSKPHTYLYYDAQDPNKKYRCDPPPKKNKKKPKKPQTTTKTHDQSMYHLKQPDGPATREQVVCVTIHYHHAALIHTLHLLNPDPRAILVLRPAVVGVCDGR